MSADTEAIFAKHQPDGHFRCGAVSAGPITLRHSMSGAVEAKVLQCTRQTNAEGDHVGGESHYPRARVEDHIDGQCCWASHVFTKAQAGESAVEVTAPRDRQRCVADGKEWPCDVEKVRLAAVDAGPPEPVTPDSLDWVAAMDQWRGHQGAYLGAGHVCYRFPTGWYQAKNPDGPTPGLIPCRDGGHP